MEKVIIILDGYAEGKNKFKDILKDNGYWFWNINVYNVLHMLTHKLGYSGEKSKDYYDFIESFKDLADRKFGFTRNYILSMIKKFLESPKANVLIIHNCDDLIAVELQEFYENCFDILLTNNEENANNPDSSYCKTLNFNNPEFNNQVLEVMKILTDNIKSLKSKE